MPVRKHPGHGIIAPSDDNVIVFLTVCTKYRDPWLTSDHVHNLLRDVWRRAEAWLVGRYVIMPDHVHLFAAPGIKPLPFDNWVRYWKSQFTKAHQIESHRWQTDHWDTRLRSEQSYDEKWDYARNNPLRHGLVGDANEWPYQGMLNELRWD